MLWASEASHPELPLRALCLHLPGSLVLQLQKKCACQCANLPAVLQLTCWPLQTLGEKGIEPNTANNELPRRIDFQKHPWTFKWKFINNADEICLEGSLLIQQVERDTFLPQLVLFSHKPRSSGGLSPCWCSNCWLWVTDVLAIKFGFLEQMDVQPWFY